MGEMGTNDGLTRWFKALRGRFSHPSSALDDEERRSSSGLCEGLNDDEQGPGSAGQTGNRKQPVVLIKGFDGEMSDKGS